MVTQVKMKAEVKVIPENDKHWSLEIKLFNDLFETIYNIGDASFCTYENWKNIATSEVNMTGDFFTLEDGYYRLHITASEASYTCNSIKIKREILAGSLIEVIEDAKKRGLKFADK